MYLPNKKRAWLPWLAGFLFVGAVVLAFHLLGGMLTPFLIAAVLAYILNPLVSKLEKHGIGRGRAAMWVMLAALFVLIALLLVIVPMLAGQLQSIIRKLPALADFVQTRLLPWFNARFGEYLVLNSDTAAEWLRNNTQSIQQSLQKTMPMLMQQGGALASGLSNIVLLPLLLYYFLLDWQRWALGIERLVPRRYLSVYLRISGSINTVLGEFMRGQLMVMLIMGMVYGTGLMLTRLESGFAIGMVAGLLVFIPYLGAFTGLLLATLAAVLQFGSWHNLLIVWAVFGAGQFLESFFVTPQIVGDRIGLSPFWVIFSLMAFGQLLGFVGMLAALPLAAVCLVLIREGTQAYLGSTFYKREK